LSWVDLASVPATRSEPADGRFRCEVLDTSGLRLARAGITLTRVTGSADRGWRLVVPAGEDRLEWSAPATNQGNRVIPADLLDRVGAGPATARCDPSWC
jgi:hypothetical protein